MVTVIDKKLVFGRDQVLTSTQASKNFGEARRRARKEPLFVSDRNDGIDTVIVGFDEFEAMAVELQELREERLYAVAAEKEYRSLDGSTRVIVDKGLCVSRSVRTRSARPSRACWRAARS